MGIKTKMEDRATQIQSDLAAQAQMKYIQWLMKEEDCDYEMAIAIVTGNTDPLEPEYMLGYKLADPVLQIALFKQISKKKRRQAAMNFADTLSDREKELFWNEVFNEENAKMFKNEYKKEKKRHGVTEDPLDQDLQA